MKTFSQLVDEYNIVDSKSDYLPLVHTTTEQPLFNIMLSKEIACQKECDIYRENLVYFFYGKAAYYTTKEMESFTNDPPVSILYNFETVKGEKMKRALPFDSGGFERYQLVKYNNKTYFTYDNPTIESCDKMMCFLYQNSENYFNNKADLSNLEKNKTKCWPLNELLTLYGRKLPNGDIKTGKQIYSIEVQFENSVPFQPSTLVIPYSFISNGFFDIQDFKNEHPDSDILIYGEEEILKNPGVPLEGYKYHELMIQKINEALN